MKLKFSYFLAFGVVVLTASVAQAQEGSQGPEELVPPSVEASTREDKPLIYDPEGKAPNTNQQPVTTPTGCKLSLNLKQRIPPRASGYKARR
jgi:hypothetical protein